MRPNTNSRFSALSLSTVTGIATTALVWAGMSAMPAMAAVAACEDVPGAYLIETGVCEITFTEDTTWTPPANIARLDALVVGGGGAGYYAVDPSVPSVENFATGGGGGDVQVVALNITGDVDIVVGAGGQITAAPGGNSSVTQNAATTTVPGGTNALNTGAGASGNGYTGNLGIVVENDFGVEFGGGGGAGADAPNATGEEAMGGLGAVVNQLPGASATLFANDTDCFGGGGGVAAAAVEWTAAYWSDSVCGGGSASIVDDDPFTWSETSTRPNSGGGGEAVFFHGNGGSYPTVHTASIGADGVVALRFDVAVPVLPDTGSNTASTAVTGLVAAGAGVIAFATTWLLRRRKGNRAN